MSQRTKSILFWTVLVLFVVLTVKCAKAGDTYDCINAKGDYYQPRPRASGPDPVPVIAYDSRQHEQRYQSMLSPEDLKRLIFIQNQGVDRYIIFSGNP